MKPLSQARSVGRPRSERIDLGLALLAVARRPGVPLTCEDIACWAGCSRQAIAVIEQSALRKLKRRLVEMDALTEVEFFG